MARRIISPEQRGHGGARQRPPLALPLLPPVPEGMTLEEFACPVSVAAELTGIKMQGLHAQIERGTLPAYLLDGRKMILLADLCETQAARRQSEQVAEENWRLAWLKIHLAEPDECLGAGCEHWTHVEPMADRERDR
jgi:hypothetical protein